MNTLPSEVAKIGPYRISEQIGEGGMGVVYLATAPDGRRVSVKTLRPWLVGGTDGRRRFEREVSTLCRVRGERVAEVIDADVDGDPPYIVTRYIDGVPLTDAVREHGPMQGDTLLQLGRGLLEALRCVHVAGVVHRDVKPANVLMSDDGPVLIDFGIAHAAEDTRLTATGFISGTPGYLAPETVLGRDPGTATDVHGWAATLVFAGTGRPPYGYGPDIAVFDRIRRGEHDLHGIEPALAGVLAAALDIDPAARPGVHAAMAALDALGSPDAAETLAMPPVPPVPVPSARPDARSDAMADAATDETKAIPAAVAPPPPPAAPAPAAGAVRAPRRASQHSPLRGHEAKVVLALGAVALVFLLSWAPYVGAAVAAATVLAGRMTWRIERRLFERRRERGRRKNDAWVAALASPWDLVAAAVPAAFQAALALGSALATGAVLAAWDGSGLRAPYLCGALVGVALIWRGPGAVRTRRGMHVMVEPLNRTPRGAWVPIAVLVVAACMFALSWESYGAVWWPADGAPSPSISFLP